MKISDLQDENITFFDKRINKYGKLIKVKYHQTVCWMMLYEDGIIQDLTVSDLIVISKEQ